MTASWSNLAASSGLGERSLAILPYIFALSREGPLRVRRSRRWRASQRLLSAHRRRERPREKRVRGVPVAVKDARVTNRQSLFRSEIGSGPHIAGVALSPDYPRLRQIAVRPASANMLAPPRSAWPSAAGTSSARRRWRGSSSGARVSGRRRVAGPRSSPCLRRTPFRRRRSAVSTATRSRNYD